jgi:allantoate deiminase
MLPKSATVFAKSEESRTGTICLTGGGRLGSSGGIETSTGGKRQQVDGTIDKTMLSTQRQPEARSPSDFAGLAQEVLRRCDRAASFTEEPGAITRTFLCDAMRELHEEVRGWMRAAGMDVRLDAAGNLIGHSHGTDPRLPVQMIGSHLDSVPDAGKYDGVLGVMVGIAAVQALGGRKLPFGIDVVAFSEEEGVRYRAPFLGSRAICGQFDRLLLDRRDARGVSMAYAFRAFGLDPARIAEAAYPAGRVGGYLEVHIEQGPVLESLEAPIGVVEGITGQSRLWATFNGTAGHAGTLPMIGRRDALAAAAELVLEVERIANEQPGLRATVGSLNVSPGATNVVPGTARLSIDVRHQHDESRMAAVAAIRARAEQLSGRRGVSFQIDEMDHHRAIPADSRLCSLLGEAVTGSGQALKRLSSGAGHDAGVMAAVCPMAMLFVRCPGGVSHSPEERVLEDDVRVALEVVVRYLMLLAERESALIDHPSSNESTGAA